MHNYQNDFGSFGGKIWLNSASEGPLPRVAVKALQEAIAWKVNPVLLTHHRFAQVPVRLKSSIAELLNVSSDEVILGNSATYGIHLLANGLPFQKGDEILLMKNDFPTDILPWLFLQDKGVQVKQLPSHGPVLTLKEISQAVSKNTRLICLPHVHTFSGHSLDIASIGNFCHSRGIIFVVNFTQSLGYQPVDLSHWPVDAMTSSGFKWLCGPYGTGFCWMKKALRETLDYPQAFWINVMSESQLNSTEELCWTAQQTARSYDVFGTANFFNYVPLTSAIDYFLEIGIDNIEKIIAERVTVFLQGLDRSKYHIISPEDKLRRSALIVFSHYHSEKNLSIFHKLSEQGIYGAQWKGNIRLSPHIFNTTDELLTVAEFLNTFK